MGAQIPSDILARIVDNLFPRALEEVLEQPDLVVKDTADLVRYKNGDLLSFLLKLDEDQMKLTEWALKGPTMVKGGAGTGKSTVALYRIKKILEHPKATGKEKVLFATYTRALMTASHQLLEQLLSQQQLDRVRVATCDELAREIVASVRVIGQLGSGGADIEALRKARKTFLPSGPSGFERRLRAQVLEKFTDRYLLEEFEWIIEGRGLVSLEEYLTTPRPGRGYPLREGVRESVWGLHQAFLEEVKNRGFERFSALRREALDLVRAGRWRGHFDQVLVDEAQDLAPSTLCLMAEIARSEEGIFFAADNKQSLYSRNYSWTVVHPRLQFKGRTAVLRRNYRSTAEIDHAAFEVLELPLERNEDFINSQCLNSGPIPVLLKGIGDEKEGEWAVRFISQMARHLRLKPSSAAVLVPNQYVGQVIAASMAAVGIPAKFYPGRELDLKADQVKVMTIHSAKGLEFPIVVVAGFSHEAPYSFTADEKELYEEWLANERKLLYVALTRAMRGLMVIVSESCEHEALLGLSSENWAVEEVS